MAHVKIYSTTTCTFCKQEKDYLDEKGIEYDYVQIDLDPAEAAEYHKVADGAAGVPFTVITQDDGTIKKVLGFRKGELALALGIPND